MYRMYIRHRQYKNTGACRTQDIKTLEELTNVVRQLFIYLISIQNTSKLANQEDRFNYLSPKCDGIHDMSDEDELH